MKRIRYALLAVVLGAATVLATTSTPVGADVALVDFTCDIPGGATGLLAGQIPDTVPIDDMEVTINDTPDPAVQGQNVHYDLDVPFPDLTGAFPDVGFDIGYIYIKQIDITQPIPAGLDPASITPTISPDPSWASVSRVGSNIVIHVQSAFPNSRIRVNVDATPATIEVQETDGSWVPINFIPSVDIDATVTGAPGTTIDWKPPTFVTKLKYNINIFLLINIQWNDVDTPCTPNDPNQTVVSTLVGTPSLSVSKSADEASVNVGDDINFHVTVENTGNVPLTGVTVSDPNAPDCDDTVGALAVGQEVTVDCVATTDAGDVPTFSNTATADSNETAPVNSNTVNVPVAGEGTVSGTVTESGSGDPVPDAWVVALRKTDFVIQGGGVADGSGAYTLDAPAGDYYLYVIDPANDHTPGFHGPPTSVTVTGGGTTTENPAMAPTRGSITGTITEEAAGDAEAGGAPISGAWALALSGTTGATEAVVPANGAGEFELPDLGVGNHFVGYIDPAGAHPTEFYPDSGNVPESTPVAVTAGNATVADGELSTKAVVGTGSTLSGTVTTAGSGAPIEGAAIVALNAADYSMARGGLTNGSGAYSLDVAAGGYKLAVLDTAGGHNMEWFDDQPGNQLALAATVTAPATADAALTANTGAISGTVTTDPGGAPIDGAFVIAVGPTGIAGGAVAAADGTYTLDGLPAGSYGVQFLDPSGDRALEFYDNSATAGGATTVAVTNGTTTSGINAALAAAP